MDTDHRTTTTPSLSADFRPARGLGNRHAQTVAGKFLRPPLSLPLHRERMETPDGDFVDLDHVEVTGVATGNAGGGAGPYVVVLHGLEGSAARPYMMTMYRALLEAGLRPVGLNFRGCSGEPNRTIRAYHSGETGDLRLVLERLRERSDGPLGVVGFSLGGNVTLKLLGELGEDARGWIAAAAAISVPFDLSAGADRISAGLMGRLYTHYFMRNLKRKIMARGDLLRDVCDPAAIRRSRTIRQFDDAATAPIHGFDGAEDYYTRSSSARFIDAIRVPTLILQSRDDPFLPPECIPVAPMESNPAITPVITDHGGHVGFIAGSVRKPEWWMEGVVGDWMGARIQD